MMSRVIDLVSSSEDEEDYFTTRPPHGTDKFDELVLSIEKDQEQDKIKIEKDKKFEKEMKQIKTAHDKERKRAGQLARLEIEKRI